VYLLAIAFYSWFETHVLYFVSAYIISYVFLPGSFLLIFAPFGVLFAHFIFKLRYDRQSWTAYLILVSFFLLYGGAIFSWIFQPLGIAMLTGSPLLLVGVIFYKLVRLFISHYLTD
jgi:hypothetical protein